MLQTYLSCEWSINIIDDKVSLRRRVIIFNTVKYGFRWYPFRLNGSRRRSLWRCIKDVNVRNCSSEIDVASFMFSLHGFWGEGHLWMTFSIRFMLIALNRHASFGDLWMSVLQLCLVTSFHLSHLCWWWHFLAFSTSWMRLHLGIFSWCC